MSVNYKELKQQQLPWIEKHRPSDLDGLMLDSKLKASIKHMIKSNNMQNIILVGPPGVGKTSTIRCIAKILFGKYYNKYVLELNASDDRGIKSVQGTIINFCKIKMFINDEDKDKYSNQKLVILDEADNMVEKAQHQIDILMEKYKDSVRFAFTCNSSSPIIESIQSKCIILRYTRLSLVQITDKLKNIAITENIKFEDNALTCIGNIAHGDMRQAINILQLLHNKNGKITEKSVNDSCDMPQPLVIKQIFADCLSGKLQIAIQKTIELKDNGYSGSDIMLGMFYAIKTDTCNDMDQKILIKLGKCIAYSNYVISKGLDTNLQLLGCLCDISNIKN